MTTPPQIFSEIFFYILFLFFLFWRLWHFGIGIGYYFLIFIFESAHMFIKFDLRPFSGVLSDLFIFVDNFLVLANKIALNRLILCHCYFVGIFMPVVWCLCVCSCAYARMYVGVWCGLVFLG